MSRGPCQIMPIGAQEWRVRTGLTNALKMVHSGAAHHHLSPDITWLPPHTWKGWRALFLVVAMPLLYKITTVITILGTALWLGHTRTGGCKSMIPPRNMETCVLSIQYTIIRKIFVVKSLFFVPPKTTKISYANIIYQ